MLVRAFLAAFAMLTSVGVGQWPSYRHDQNNSGFVASGGPKHSVHLRPVWVYKADSFITSTPILSGGLAYVGTGNGDVVALDVASGEVRWTAHLGANSDEVY